MSFALSGESPKASAPGDKTICQSLSLFLTTPTV